MNILMLLDFEFPPDIRVENEIAALAAAGHEVHLACTTRKSLPAEERNGRVFIHRKSMSTFIYKSSAGCLKLPFYFNYWRKYIFKLFEDWRFDAIHVHDLPLSKIGVEVKRKYNLPLIIDLHENWPALLRYATHTQTLIGKLISSDKQWIRYEKKMLPEADFVITIVHEAKSRVISLGIAPEKIRIVSNTVNIENIPIHKRKRSDSDFILFYGGGLNRHRGIQVVLEAIALLSKRNITIKFWIAGSGSYKKILEEQSVRSGIEHNIRFYGQKPFNEMLELLAEADAAIIPHLRNENNDASSPNKLYQYMYLEIPVISSDCSSLKRILGDTGAGFVYRHDSPAELASLLEKLYADRELLRSKGLNGKQAVLANYNWKVDKERLVKVYDEIENERGK